MSKRGIVLTALFVLLVAGAVTGFLVRRRSQHLLRTAEAYESLRYCLYRSPLGGAEKPSDRLVAIDLCNRWMADLDTCQPELDTAIASWSTLGVDTNDPRFGRAIELSRRAYAPDGTPSRWLTGDEHPLIDELEDALAKADLPTVESVEGSSPCVAPAKFSTNALTPFDDKLSHLGVPLTSRPGDTALRVDFQQSEAFGSRLCSFAATGPATVTCGVPAKAAPGEEPIAPRALAALMHAKRIVDTAAAPGLVVFTDEDDKTFFATRAGDSIGAAVPLAMPAHWHELRSCPSERGPVLAMSASDTSELRVFYPKDTTAYEEPIIVAQPFGDSTTHGEEHGSALAFACSPSGVPRWAWHEGGTFSTLSCPRSGCARAANHNVWSPLEARDVSITPFGEDRVLIVIRASQAGRFAEHVLTVRARTGTIETVSNGADTVLWGKLSNMESGGGSLQVFAFGDAAWAAFRIDGRLRALRTRSDVNGFEIVRAP